MLHFYERYGILYLVCFGLLQNIQKNDSGEWVE